MSASCSLEEMETSRLRGTVVAGTVVELRTACATLRRAAGEGSKLGLVPTMGALHAGHLSLVRAARSRCDGVIVSIFVNPTQFAPGEDFECYPRTWEADLAKLAGEGVDVVFAPKPGEMYPSGLPTSFVEVPGIGDRLDGVSRPGHFRGVATVVSKLFLAAAPDFAFFGAKDAAQVAVLRAMTRDLLFGLELIVCPTVREADGLAMSSRNRYLSAEERKRARVLSQALFVLEQVWLGGERRLERLLEVLRRPLERVAGMELEYAEIVDPATLLPLRSLQPEMLAAVAAKVGSTRLIDNISLFMGEQG